jgi:protein-S-isoprenylcysteine O-methyltransferase Ste14
MNDTLKSWLLVIIQGLLLAGLVLASQAADTPRFVDVGGRIVQIVGALLLLVAVYNLRKSLTALPLPTKNGQLQVRGLYRYVRHPMYVGVLVLSLGIAISGNTLLHYVLFALLYLLLDYKARYEEQLLAAKYPGYKSYQSKTPRFIPRVRRG